ncbi:MAG: UDP-N-acetylmuramate dehydrogenase [Betaproteobacteria bacterium]|nr:UDP-N-acetylmuramate dehydrogenase [Betaproteobacteria bacterium]
MNMTEPAQFIAEGLRGTLHRDVDMRRHTSWRAGGHAERVYQPADLADLATFLRTLPAGEPLIAIGLGSNLLVRDGGLRGTVLLLHGALNELRKEPDGLVSPQEGGRGCKATEVATTTLYAQAGVAGAKLARFAALHNLASAEFFAGIPGTVGGMLAMNAGCYGSEIWDVVARVQVMTHSGDLLERTPQEYEIGYRHVVLKKKVEGRREKGENLGPGVPLSPPLFPLPQEFFVGAWLKFAAGDGEIAREKIKTLLDKRIASQPLNLPNAGSVFRNPPGEYAARLIEQCGLKGRQIGGARVSEKHANFIVNTGNATAADIENLINEVRATVQRQAGIELHPEVRIIGEAK